jgi:hypothetical protein
LARDAGQLAANYQDAVKGVLTLSRPTCCISWSSRGRFSPNHHTPLISHTSVDILTSLTGVYGEKVSIPIGNTILYFSGGSSKFTSSDNLGTTSVPQMVDQRQDPSGAVGSIHPRGLRCGRFLGGQHRV